MKSKLIIILLFTLSILFWIYVMIIIPQAWVRILGGSCSFLSLVAMSMYIFEDTWLRFFANFTKD